MNILLSALSCSPQLGSEALVGYHAVHALSSRFHTVVITSAQMQAPEGVMSRTIPVHFHEPNDVGLAQLLWFELRQRLVIERLLRAHAFGVIHRVTPSGYKASLLPVPSVPFAVGPLLASDRPPESFHSVFQPCLPRAYSVAQSVARIAHGIARRAFDRFSTLDRLIENAAVIFVGTELTRRRLPAHLHSRCRLVPYSGVEHDQFTPPVTRRRSRRPQLLFVGRVVPYKGVELLLRAVATARRRCQFDLKIVGGGYTAYRRYCQRLSASLKLTKTVTFIDHQPRNTLAEVYRGADVFCMPSIETYGIALLEAMSSGCAPLVSDFNGPGEIVKPGTGIKVPLKTPDQFIEEYAEGIIRFVHDAGLRDEVGAKARDHVVRCHDWKRIEASLLEIYDQVFVKP